MLDREIATILVNSICQNGNKANAVATMKVQIKSLRAINCGPLRDVTIDFTTNGAPRPITLLASANGSGKTTILELMLYLATRIQFQQLENERSDNIYARAEYARLDLDVDENDLSVTIGPLPDEERLPNDTIRLVPINHGYSAEASGDVALKLRKTIASQWRQPLAASKYLELGSLIYFPSNRQVASYEGAQVQRIDTLYHWSLVSFSARSYEETLDSYLIWLDYAEPVQYQRTIQFLNSLDFDGKTFGIIRKKLKAVVYTRDGQTHDVSQLSSGEQNILIMLLDLYRHLIPNSIVLIDEIESHLHPAFQHKLGNALKKMQQEIPFQLIATTHSHEFLKIFGPENTLILTEY